MKRKINIDETLNAFRTDAYDPEGSYTGLPLDGDKPVQDADDL